MIWCNLNSYYTGNPIYGRQDLEQTPAHDGGVNIRRLAIKLHSADSDTIQALARENHLPRFPAGLSET